MTTMTERCEALVASGAMEIRLTMPEMVCLMAELSSSAEGAKWTEAPQPLHPRQGESGFCGVFKGVPLFREARASKNPHIDDDYIIPRT